MDHATDYRRLRRITSGKKRSAVRSLRQRAERQRRTLTSFARDAVPGRRTR